MTDTGFLVAFFIVIFLVIIFALVAVIGAVTSAVAAVVLLHLWKRNNMISIIGGTAIYMVFVQIIFA